MVAEVDHAAQATRAWWLVKRSWTLVSDRESCQMALHLSDDQMNSLVEEVLGLGHHPTLPSSHSHKVHCTLKGWKANILAPTREAAMVLRLNPQGCNKTNLVRALRHHAGLVGGQLAWNLTPQESLVYQKLLENGLPQEVRPYYTPSEGATVKDKNPTLLFPIHDFATDGNPTLRPRTERTQAWLVVRHSGLPQDQITESRKKGIKRRLEAMEDRRSYVHQEIKATMVRLALLAADAALLPVHIDYLKGYYDYEGDQEPPLLDAVQVARLVADLEKTCGLAYFPTQKRARSETEPPTEITPPHILVTLFQHNIGPQRYLIPKHHITSEILELLQRNHLKYPPTDPHVFELFRTGEYGVLASYLLHQDHQPPRDSILGDYVLTS